MMKLFRYLKPVWWEVLLSMLLVGFQTWLQLTLPDYMNEIMKLIQNQVPGVGVDFAALWTQIGWMSLVSVGIFALAVFVGLLNSHSASVFSREMRKAVFSKIINEISLGDYDSFGTASLITRTINDVEQVKDTYYMSVRIIVVAPMTMIIAIIKTVTIKTAAQLAWVLAIALAICVIVIVIVFFVISPIFVKIQEAIDRVTLVFREGLTGVRVIRAFNQQPSERERFDTANANQTKMIIKTGRTMAIVMPIIFLVFDLSYIFVYLYGYALFDGASITNLVSFGEITMVAVYTMNIMNAFMMMAMILISVPRAFASAKRINAILDTKSTICDPDKPISLEEITTCGVVEFKDVSFTFPDADTPTLKGLNFKTKPGKVTAIIGTTGSGKSSIINLIPRFYDATVGEVLIDGVDVREYKISDLRDKIGFVPQQATLFSGSIRTNLQFGKEDATDEEMLEALDVAQAKHFVLKKEAGLDSEVNQGGKNFSGGQKQRLSIARALVKKPEVYIFDDSFSALDFKTDIRLRKALKTYASNASVIVVAQRVASILDADNILVLQNGEIVGQGTHNQLLRKCPTYKDIVMSQMDAEEIKKTIALGEQLLLEGGEA